MYKMIIVTHYECHFCYAKCYPRKQEDARRLLCNDCEDGLRKVNELESFLEGKTKEGHTWMAVKECVR